MAISRGYRFPIDFDEAFPQGLVMVGEMPPDNTGEQSAKAA